MKLIFSVLLLTAFIFGTNANVMPDTVVVKKSNTFITPGDKDVKPTPNKMAAAQMSHKEHLTSGIKCEQCHHPLATAMDTSKTAKKEMVCAKCHKGEAGSKTVMSNSCLKCHKAMKKGTQKCKECHTVAIAKE